MNDALQIILKKLESIENRLEQLEGKGRVGLEKETIEKKEYDPLFNQAWEMILKEENDVSATFLAKQLNIDVKRAEAIMDQLQAAGFGVCYTKEV